jgi:phosphoglycolate phosphatase
VNGLVAFDLDGTLVDTPSAIVETLTAALVDLGFAAPEPARARATIGLPLEAAVAGLAGLPPDDERVGTGVRRYQALFAERVLPRARELLYPGVVEGLATLDGLGFTLTVATSKVYASAHALLTGAGIRDRFDMVVGADQVDAPKPDPATARRILDRYAFPAERAVMVGDTTHDMTMARAAGMRAVAVTYGVHDRDALDATGPACVADTFDAVVGWIRATTDEARRSAR